MTPLGVGKMTPLGGKFGVDVGRSTIVTLKSPDEIRRDQARLLAGLGEECGEVTGRRAEARGAPLGLAGLVRGAIPAGCRVNRGSVAKCIGEPCDLSWTFCK